MSEQDKLELFEDQPIRMAWDAEKEEWYYSIVDVVAVLTDQPESEIQKWLTAVEAKHYYLQPCSCKNTTEVVQYIQQHPKWRLSLQTHKYISIQ